MGDKGEGYTLYISEVAGFVAHVQDVTGLHWAQWCLVKYLDRYSDPKSTDMGRLWGVRR